jgi:hypothetical protein
MRLYKGLYNKLKKKEAVVGREIFYYKDEIGFLYEG